MKKKFILFSPWLLKNPVMGPMIMGLRHTQMYGFR